MTNNKRYVIDKYSHGIFVRVLHQDDRALLMEYSRELAVFDTNWDPRAKRKVTKVKAVYATANDNRTVFGFLVAELPHIVRFLERRGVASNTIQFNTHVPNNGQPVPIKLMPGVGPRDEEQEKVMSFITDPVSMTRILPLRTGGGKAQPLDAKIKIPGGWTTMGEIKTGDTITTHTGDVQTVTGVYPQGENPVYKLTFADGRVATADKNHLWEVFSNTIEEWCVFTTAELMHLMDKDVVSVRLITSERSPQQKLSLDPYLLGTTLGVRSSSPDHVTHKTTPVLKKLGLLDHKENDPHIPALYLNASHEQRLALAQGLIQAGGCSLGHGVVTYTCRHYELAENVVDLIRSLGGLVDISVGYSNDEPAHAKRYTLHIRHPTPNIFFRTNRDDLPKESSNRELRLRVTDVTYIGKEETQCISVSHPSKLYVTDNYVVTHNTACGLMAAAHHGVRTGLVTGATHIKTWLDSIGWVLGYDHKDVCVVKGGQSLANVVHLAQSGNLDYKMIFFSVATIRNFINDYLETGYTINGVSPVELFPTLGIGFRIIDEAHESIHAVCIQAIHTHCARILYLSATLKTEDPFTMRQYAKLFPDSDTFKDGRNNTHVKTYSARYGLNDPKAIKYMGSKGYSHVAFENSVLDNPAILKNYYGLIKHILDATYIKVRQPGQKCLIFCSTVAMCKEVEERLKESYKDTDLTISHYVSSHDPSVLYEHDIVVSTPKSAGTGKDIKNLSVAILTTAISSVQLNLQAMGRLRPITDWPEQDPIYVWLTCTDIDKHITYDLKKRDQFDGRVKSIEDWHTNLRV